MGNKLKSLSVYFLLLELHNDGSAGFLPELEPIQRKAITDELERRTNLKFGDNEKSWSDWFISNSKYGTELERSNLMIFLKTKSSMERIWNEVSGD